MKRLLQYILLLVLVSLTGCATDPVTGKSAYNIYTLDDDIKIGTQGMAANVKQMQKQHVRLNADPEKTAQLNGIIRRLGAVTHYPNLPYSVTLFHTNIVNAAAFPGGPMMVFEGLYDRKKGLVRDEDELAAVMGHELAHVNCRHTTRRMSVVTPVVVIAEIGVAVLEAKDQQDWAQVLAAGFTVSGALLLPAYSRKDEAQADAVGLMYMAKAGYDPRAAPRIWQRAMQQNGNHGDAIGGGFNAFFSDHPSDKARYEALQKLLPAAMAEYAKVHGGYPADYAPPADAPVR
ncbi:MAG: M48 family peptidase [Verrucomicrobia bacterium]|nr:MAG: M48 family peptidase [Verrucomicrobiota bacterium]